MVCAVMGKNKGLICVSFGLETSGRGVRRTQVSARLAQLVRASTW